MDEKAKSEARRRKILDNAEARLRFIKEGIPWRTPEATQDEISQNENKDTEEESPSGRELSESCEAKLENINTEVDNNIRVNDFPQEGLSNSEDKLFDLNSDCNQKLPYNYEDFKNQETESVQPDSPSKSSLNDKQLNNSFVSPPKKPLDTLNEPELIKPKKETDKISEEEKDKSQSDPFKTLKELLNESSVERREHKQKVSDQNRFAWISCFLMLCLGVVVRISYATGFSWIFNEMMLVPFVAVVTPRLVSIASDPPAPSGTLAQALIMSGVKLKVINKVFTIVTLFRTFLQLFSVYMVSFLLTHQLAETLF